jgi:hypothetical protein
MRSSRRCRSRHWLCSHQHTTLSACMLRSSGWGLHLLSLRLSSRPQGESPPAGPSWICSRVWQGGAASGSGLRSASYRWMRHMDNWPSGHESVCLDFQLVKSVQLTVSWIEPANLCMLKVQKWLTRPVRLCSGNSVQSVC